MGIVVKYNYIAVDFDGTLCSISGKQRLVHKLVLLYIKYHQKKGTIIILNTLRKGAILQAALKWLKEKEFTPNLVNENCQRLIAKWGDSRKIAADLYIDDRNIGPIGWLLRTFGR